MVQDSRNSYFNKAKNNNSLAMSPKDMHGKSLNNGERRAASLRATPKVANKIKGRQSFAQLKTNERKKSVITQEEIERIKADKDHLFGKVQLVLTDDKLDNHI